MENKSLKLFLHAAFSVPEHVDGGSEAEKFTETSATIEHRFDGSNCKPAVIGLPENVEPVKPEAGDYNYSGMHDHGTLPFPREGGEYAQLIGFVCEAKKASDHFLTKVIEKRSVSG
mmetsp:Transcript_30708/g.69375  ORF Transcript_30708/g.69375 Transcript_30708/m.69375 type:complete len:116 (+) Transcript_30708:73-420(+)